MRRSGVCTRGFNAPRARPQHDVTAADVIAQQQHTAAGAAVGCATSGAVATRTTRCAHTKRTRARDDDDDDDEHAVVQRKRAHGCSDKDDSGDGNSGSDDDDDAATTSTTTMTTTFATAALTRAARPRIHHSPDVTRRVVYYPPAQPLSTLALACSQQQQQQQSAMMMYATQSLAAHDNTAYEQVEQQQRQQYSHVVTRTSALCDTVVYNTSAVTAHDNVTATQQQQQHSKPTTMPLLPWQRDCAAEQQQQQQLIGHTDIVAAAAVAEASSSSPPLQQQQLTSTQVVHTPPSSALAAANAFLCALDMQQQQQQQQQCHLMSPSALHVACAQTSVYDTPTRMLTWSQATTSQQQQQQQHASPCAMLHTTMHTANETTSDTLTTATATAAVAGPTTATFAACTPADDNNNDDDNDDGDDVAAATTASHDTLTATATDTANAVDTRDDTDGKSVAAAAAATASAAAAANIANASALAAAAEVYSDGEDDEALAREVDEDVRMSADVAYTPDQRHDAGAATPTTASQSWQQQQQQQQSHTTLATALPCLSQCSHRSSSSSSAAAAAALLTTTVVAAEPAAERVDDERISSTPPLYEGHAMTAAAHAAMQEQQQHDDDDDGEDSDELLLAMQQQQSMMSVAASRVVVAATDRTPPPTYVSAIECARAAAAAAAAPSTSPSSCEAPSPSLLLRATVHATDATCAVAAMHEDSASNTTTTAVAAAQSTRTTFRFASKTAAATAVALTRQQQQQCEDDEQAVVVATRAMSDGAHDAATTADINNAADDGNSDSNMTTTTTATAAAPRAKRTRFVLSSTTSAATTRTTTTAAAAAEDACASVSATYTKDEVEDAAVVVKQHEEEQPPCSTLVAAAAGVVDDEAHEHTTRTSPVEQCADEQQQQQQQLDVQTAVDNNNNNNNNNDVRHGATDEADMAPNTFYDLPLQVAELFARYRGVRALYAWQHTVLTRPDVRAGGNLVYSLPTSGGKTLVAEVALLRCVLLRRRSCLFVVPFVALAEEKTTALQPFADALGFTVDGHYGMTGRFPLPAPPTLFVCTIEKANSVLNNLLEEGAQESLGAVVVDELHMLGESRRGATLELLLSKLLMLSDRNVRTCATTTTAAVTTNDTSSSNTATTATATTTHTASAVQILGMSATVPNLPAIARWLRAACYESTHRPVPLQQYSVVDGMVLRDGDVNTRNLNGGSDLERLYELATEVPAEASVLVFCASRQQCVDTACGLVRYLQHRSTRSAACAMRDHGIAAPAPACSSLAGGGEHNNSGSALAGPAADDADNEAAVVAGVLPTSTMHALHALPPHAAGEVAALLVELHALGHHEAAQLAEVLPYGVAFHHGGLLNEERELIERAYRARHVRVLCCTSTLAAGVNLPARRVVFKTPYIGRAFLTKSRYTQMCGRAGRAGLDAHGESYLLLSRRDRVRGHALMHADLEPCCSQMLEDSDAFARALLECVGVRLVTCAADAQAWARNLLVVHAPGPVDAALRAGAEAAAAEAAATTTTEAAVQQPSLLATDSQSLHEPPPLTTTTTTDANKEGKDDDMAVTVQRMVSYALELLQANGLVRRGAHGVASAKSTATTTCSMRPSSHSSAVAVDNNNKNNSNSSNNIANDNADDDDAAAVLAVTAFGASAVRSCFSVEEAMLVRSEFDQLRHTGLILADDLHLCYFLTPLREVGNCDWALYRVLLSRLSDTRQHIASLLGVDEYFVDQRASGLGGGPPHTAPTSEDGRRKFFVARRFYVALMLADALSEVPMPDIEARYNVSRGQLQSLMRSASLFSSSITSFCHAMEWFALEAVLASFVKRLDLGVKPDIVPLMEIRGVQPARARALWNAGLRDASAIAACDADEMVARVRRHNGADSKAAKFFSRRSALALLREAKALLERQLRVRQGEVQALSSRLTRS